MSGAYPSSKAEAVRSGARFYTISTPCPRGHVSPRYTRGSVCVECVRERNAEKLGKIYQGVGVRGLVSLERARAAQVGGSVYQGEPCKHGHTERFTASNNCVACNKAALARDKERRRWSRLFREYGLTEKGFNDLLLRQGSLCAICECALSDLSAIHVDHCHASGLVRGLLCGRCNQAIGLFREDADVMRKAIAYVSR